MHVTRLAPSPTGALHLGNARTFLINWALARCAGWRIILRIEDLDTPRVKPETIDQTRDLLRWIGIDWDEEVPLQSSSMEPFREAMTRLAAASLVYPSDLSRQEIAQALGAPHESEGESCFPASLRPKDRPSGFENEFTNWRVVCPPDEILLHDGYAGAVRHAPATDVGDFVVWTKRGTPAYQLAVVVDDARQGVTQIVRGDDLLPSAARQTILYRLLELEPSPAYTHLPLVRGIDGRRLAKRHGDTRLDSYRANGVAPERVIALIARWSGIEPTERLSAQEFAEAFRLDTMPRTDVTFSPEDDRWLFD